MLGGYEVLEERPIPGGGRDVLARDGNGKEVRLWVGAPGSGEGADPADLQRRLARVYHSGLPRVLGSEVLDGRAVLRLEAYRGETLAERFAAGPIAPPDALDLARSVAAALVKAHAKGIEHGAVTADDVLLAADGRTLLLRVGFGPFLDERPAVAPVPDPVFGAGDVFAVARLLVRALEGRDPFEGAATLEAGVRDEHGFDPSLPQGLRRLLARAISPDPARRMIRAEELAGDLGVLRASWDSIVASEAPLRRPRGMRLLGWILAGFVAMIVLRVAMRLLFG
jgi:serine/threonine-protein kinase